MPVTKSAIKALRQQKRRTIVNSAIKAKMRTIIKAVKTNSGTASLSEMYSTVDRAAKRGIIHPNRAARIKSRITKSVADQDQPTKSAPVKSAPVKTTKAKPVKKSPLSAKKATKKAPKKPVAKKAVASKKTKTAKKA